MLTTVEGAVMQARTARSLQAYDASIAQLRDYLRRLQDAARQPSSRKRRLRARN
ncbi:MAG: hypothetical protein ACR2L2_12245 [Acidobacteriota bacterium]